jgi:hypothetical protein
VMPWKGSNASVGSSASRPPYDVSACFHVAVRDCGADQDRLLLAAVDLGLKVQEIRSGTIDSSSGLQCLTGSAPRDQVPGQATEFSQVRYQRCYRSCRQKSQSQFLRSLQSGLRRKPRTTPFRCPVPIICPRRLIPVAVESTQPE